MQTVQGLRLEVERLKGRRDQIQGTIFTLQERVKDRVSDLKRHEEAREVIREVAIKTQEQLQYHIGDITSLALGAVYKDPYKLVVEFVQRRNKTECDLLFEREGEKIDEPMNSCGGGTVDVASFALRVASWSMQKPRSRAILILDEPFKNVSANLLPRASEMLKEVSRKLSLQMLMVTHSEELMEASDQIFKLSIKNKVTQID